MGVLTEYVRKEAEQLKREASQREETMSEWLTSLNRLYDQLEGWRRDADDGLGILKFQRTAEGVALFEPRVGRYWAPLLRISLGSISLDRSVTIAPRARYVIATIKPPGREAHRADGMVEIKGEGAADSYLFRWKEDGRDRWYIQSVARWNSDPEYGAVEELDRDRFEASVLYILK